LPALDEFEPELIMIRRASTRIATIRSRGSRSSRTTTHGSRASSRTARRHAGGRIVSSLEGGYDLSALGRSVVAHVRELIIG
jgi:hypothetical protein